MNELNMIFIINSSYVKFMMSNFEEFYALITSSKQLKTYAFHIYLDFSHFLKSWSKYRRFKSVPFIRPNQTPPTCWKLGLEGSKS
jgi:hypothetical protein